MESTDLFSLQELSNEHTMNFLGQFWMFGFTIGVTDLLGAEGTKTRRRAAIFAQRVSDVTGHLIFACQPVRLKSALLGHATTHGACFRSVFMVMFEFRGFSGAFHYHFRLNKHRHTLEFQYVYSCYVVSIRTYLSKESSLQRSMNYAVIHFVPHLWCPFVKYSRAAV